MSTHIDVLRYIERRLTPVERARAVAHLTMCRPCRDQVEQARAALDALHPLFPALRALPWPARALWPSVWVRVQRATSLPAWQLVASLSMVTVFFSLSSIGQARGLAAPLDAAQISPAPQVAVQTPWPHSGAAGLVAATNAPLPAPAPIPVPTS